MYHSQAHSKLEEHTLPPRLSPSTSLPCRAVPPTPSILQPLPTPASHPLNSACLPCESPSLLNRQHTSQGPVRFHASRLCPDGHSSPPGRFPVLTVMLATRTSSSCVPAQRIPSPPRRPTMIDRIPLAAALRGAEAGLAKPSTGHEDVGTARGCPARKSLPSTIHTFFSTTIEPHSCTTGLARTSELQDQLFVAHQRHTFIVDTSCTNKLHSIEGLTSSFLIPSVPFLFLS